MTTASASPSAAGNGLPRLSVVVNNYNYARFLAEALDSAIGQLRDGDELLVVDDGSSDESPAILRAYQAAHGIRVISQPNRGHLAAVCAGIQAARGDVLVLLDSDDSLLDGYLDRLRLIYSQHPGVAFACCDALVQGESAGAARRMRRMLDRLVFPTGVVGCSRWATSLFHEFVGVPTSGISLRRQLAMDIVAIAISTPPAAAIASPLARCIGISPRESRRHSISADGVIVRGASLLQAVKFFDEHPGFRYRIHGANKYAASNALARWYLRRSRRRLFERHIVSQLHLALRPTTKELRDEIAGRAFCRHRARRLHLRACYCRAIVISRGSVASKLAALALALGMAGRGAVE